MCRATKTLTIPTNRSRESARTLGTGEGGPPARRVDHRNSHPKQIVVFSVYWFWDESRGRVQLLDLQKRCPAVESGRFRAGKGEQAYMEKLLGVIANFDHAMIIHKNVYYFGFVRSELIDLTVKHGQLNHIEIAIGGYNDDSRSLYEVPEVRRWIKMVHTRWPDSLFWLTPGSLWVWVLCLNPSMHERLPDGRMQVALDPKIIAPQFAASLAVGERVLRKGGMVKDQVDIAIDQAERNLMQMFERKKLGDDYTVAHPESGEVLYYKAGS
jgi:hypothetical protein